MNYLRRIWDAIVDAHHDRPAESVQKCGGCERLFGKHLLKKVKTVYSADDDHGQVKTISFCRTCRRDMGVE